MTTITGDTRLYATFADPVHHVQTPRSINRLFAQCGTNAVLVAIHVDAAHLAQAMAGLNAMRNLDGFVVTVPHVNGTSLGLRAGDAIPCDVSRLGPAQIVAEIIIQPAETPLLSAALAKGCRIHHGAPMLACQIELMADFIGDDAEVRA
nr:hypothetical protein [uncultured Duganella sp.]